MTDQHGGKRQGAGRKPNSKGITNSVKNLFTSEAEQATQNIINISRDSNHPQQLKALEMILARGIGQPLTIKEQAMDSYLNGEISATRAALIIESTGGTVNLNFKRYVNEELRLAELNHKYSEDAHAFSELPIVRDFKTTPETIAQLPTVQDETSDDAPPWKHD